MVAIFRLSLDDDLPDPAEIDELGNVRGTEIGLQGLVDIRNRDTEELRASAVEIEIELLLRRREGRGDAGQGLVLAGLGNKILGYLVQLLRAAAAHALNVEFKTAGGAQARDRWWIQRENNALLDASQFFTHIGNYGKSRLTLLLALLVWF